MFLAICVLLVIAVVVKPQGKFVVVIANPLSPPARIAEIIGGAGGSFVAGGRYPWIAIAYSDADGFALRLLRSGAILVLNNRAAVGCLQRIEP